MGNEKKKTLEKETKHEEKEQKTKTRKRKTKTSKKNIVTYVIAILIILTVGGLLLIKNDDKETKKEDDNIIKVDGDELMVANVNPGVINDKEQNGLKFTNTSLISTENSATLTTSVENTTGNDIEVRVFNIIVKDKTDKTITVLQGYVGGVVPVGEKRDIVSHVDINLTEATEIEYQIVN